MSKQAKKVYTCLKKIFPQAKIRPEHYVNFKGTRLFFDFYLSQYNILIEVQGRQHYEFIKHFHIDAEGYNKSKFRDNLKIEYAELSNMTLVLIKYDEKINKSRLLKLISEAQND